MALYLGSGLNYYNFAQPAGGDLAGQFPDPVLADINPTPAGTFGNATNVARVTVNSKGQVVAAQNVAIAVAPSGAAGGSLAGTYPNPTIANNAIVSANLADLAPSPAGTYGDGNNAVQMVVNAKGQVTSVATVPITGGGGGGSPSGPASGDLGGNYPNPVTAGLGGIPFATFSTTVDIGLGRNVPFRGLQIGPASRYHTLLWGEYSIQSFNGNGWNQAVPIPISQVVPLNFTRSIFTLVQVVATDFELGGNGGAYSLWLGTLWRYDQATQNWIPVASNPNQENKYGTLGGMQFRTQTPVVNNGGILDIQLQPGQNTRDTFYSFYVSVVTQ